MTDNRLKTERIGWETLLIAGLLIAVFIPFLGFNLFTTKGEPREAIVAVSMLQQGNWILPVSFGEDIPYKPPMLAWCIAALGWLNGSTVTEYLSRLPSAIAVIVMLICCFRFYARRKGTNIAAAMTLVTATSVEVFRTATICRVDMLLTMFVVTALLAFYRQWERHREGTWKPSIVAALMMTGAVLTKGPVGMLLPAMVIWVFRLMKGNRFRQTTVSVGVSAVMSLILPLAWYYAAYQQGGEEFYRLALEENFGRFTGTMSYESHENGVWYNFASLAWGLAPYTVLLLISLVQLPWKRFRIVWKGWWKRLRAKDPIELFSMLAALLIFVFYCIPKSKRSVYLLPCYPFIGYFIAVYARWLVRSGKLCVKVYGWIICVAGILAGVAVWILSTGYMPVKGSESMECISEGLQGCAQNFLSAFMWFMVIAAGLMLGKQLIKKGSRGYFGWTLVYTAAIYCMAQTTVIPASMNYKSDKSAVGKVEAIAGSDATVYSYSADPLMRFYALNYYLGDRMKVFRPGVAGEGYVVVAERDLDSFKKASEAYNTAEAALIDRKGVKQRNRLHLFRLTGKYLENC